MALTAEEVANFQITGPNFGLGKYQELVNRGATPQQIEQIARKHQVIGTGVMERLPQLSSQTTVGQLPGLRRSETPGSSIDPSLRPYLEMGLQRAEQLFFGQPPQFFPGQTYVSPSQQTLDALQQQEALARQGSPALQQSQQAYMQSLGGLGQTAGGGFLMGSPYRQAMIESATRPLMQQFEQSTLPVIQSAFSRAGRYGSGAQARAIGQAQEATSRAIGDVSATIAGQDFARERALQQQAQTALPQAAMMAPQIYGMQFLPGQQLGQVGAAREQIAAMPLQEQMQRFQFGQQVPYQQLQGFLSSVYGTPMAQTPYTAPAQSNVAGSVLGGALAGSQLAGMVGGNTGLFGFTPQQTQLGGAALGGLLGLF
jgi:hypothetical protein